MYPGRPSSRAGESRLLAYCRARLAAVVPGSPRTVDDVVAALESHRRRPLEIVISDPVEGALPSGLWLNLRDRDVIWVDRRTSPMHRLVIIGHECGHMICGHQPTSLRDEPSDLRHILDLAGHQLAGLSTAHVAAILGHCRGAAARDRVDWRREREAEVTGRLLAQRLLGESPDRIVASLAEL